MVALRQDLTKYKVYRYKQGEQQVRIIIYDGPERPSEYLCAKFDIGELPYLGANLIEHSIARHLLAKRLTI
jgi:hypothetical protein